MDIENGVIVVYKNEEYGNYSMSLVKYDGEKKELVKGEDGKTIRLYINVYLPEGTEYENMTRIRFKGKLKLSIKEDGTLASYVRVDEVLEVLPLKNNTTSTQETEVGSEFVSNDELPF